MTLSPRKYAVAPDAPAPVVSFGSLEEAARAYGELQSILAEVVEMLPQSTDTAPRAPREGLIRQAVSPWNPLSGTPPYWVQYRNGAWAAL